MPYELMPKEVRTPRPMTVRTPAVRVERPPQPKRPPKPPDPPGYSWRWRK
jgi:hypothetical protein